MIRGGLGEILLEILENLVNICLTEEDDDDDDESIRSSKKGRRSTKSEKDKSRVKRRWMKFSEDREEIEESS